MNQGELTAALAKRFSLTTAESRDIIKFIIANIATHLKRGHRVYFRGFGSFTKQKRAPKKVPYGKGGTMITIPGGITVKFNPSKHLLEYLRLTWQETAREIVRQNPNDLGKISKALKDYIEKRKKRGKEKRKP